jgi:hypothetical protein
LTPIVRARTARLPGAIAAAALLTMPAFALAQSGGESLPKGGASPGSADSIPTDKPQLRAFCADRPGQATLPCTVDRGHFQLETALADATYDRSGGVVTDSLALGESTLKYGVADRTDVELSLAPYEVMRTHDPQSHATGTIYGPSDLTVALKQNIFGDYRGPLATAIEPFLSLPTGRSGIGDGGVEGGVLLPVAFGFKSAVLNLNAELDLRRDADGSGVHPEEVEIVNVAWSLPANLGLTTELFARERQDPAGVVTETSADVALALGIPKDLQLDVGANFGLNSQTPAVEAYCGVSKRF